MNPVVKLPDIHQHFHTARKVLQDCEASPEAVTAARDVLWYSPDFHDIMAVRNAGKAQSVPSASDDDETSEAVVIVAALACFAAFVLAMTIGWVLQAWWLG